ncbi:UNVERIFIED_CONTAM: hypothetical protein HDU68_004710 [Siphonaria sp. JEL0065]|nr:hypothetical protein HDU68_004710 [Siphonaria sp. JEL0065]
MLSEEQTPSTIIEIIKEEAAAPYYRWTKQFKSGIIRYYQMFNKPRIFVSSSTALRRIFGTHSHLYGKDPTSFEAINRFLGKGLLTIEDSFHKRQRGIINPIFRVKHINCLIPTFILSAQELMKSWDSTLKASQSKDIQFELSGEMSKPTLDVIGRAGFGYDFESVNNGESPLYHSYTVALSSFTLAEALINNLAPFLNWILPSRRAKRAKLESIRLEIRSQCELILQARKDAIKAGDETATDLLTVLLKANASEDEKNRLNDEEVMAQVMTFLAAGHETTSVALTWTIDFLANNPRAQSKLREELREQLQERESEPSVEYVTSTNTYLDAVCKESLRLVPPAPITNRITVEDDLLDGYRIPKGTVVLVSPAVNHRLEEYWGADALEFKPERWISSADNTEDSDSRRPFGAYMPFLLGPRNCIGQRFAILEMKAILAVLVRGFEFVKVEGQVIKKKLRLTWKPEPGLQMIVKRVS